jgi:hypothetical protein
MNGVNGYKVLIILLYIYLLENITYGCKSHIWNQLVLVRNIVGFKVIMFLVKMSGVLEYN